MIENTKCECGHQNPTGTVLCESCGKPQVDLDDMALLEMRYDGASRRSQYANQTLLDRVWRFFSSVKIAVYLIIITLIGAAFGTIFPQEEQFLGKTDFAAYYENTYGPIGKVYYMLGLSHTFTSWWFLGLLVMIGTSLVICSLDRVLPLYRALSKQQIRKHEQFLLRQRAALQLDLTNTLAEQGVSQEEWASTLEAALRKRRFRVYREGTALLAEKNRFSRWGPYINHIGLIIFLLTLLLRSFPGMTMDQYVDVREGETVSIPGTNLFLKNEKFTLELYSEDELRGSFKKEQMAVPKLYRTSAVLYTCQLNCSGTSGEPVLKEVERHNIEVNDPLAYKGLSAYQFDYAMNPQIRSVNTYVTNKATGESFGPVTLRTKNPQTSYTAGPYTFKVRDYYPDFMLNDQGLPATKSREPNAPAFVFIVTGPGLPANGAPYLYFLREIDKVNFQQDQLNKAVSGLFEMKAKSMNDVQLSTYVSTLNIRKDTVVPYLFVGAIISMIGLSMGFYWYHRRVWMRLDDNVLTLGAHTNKNGFGLRKEVAAALAKAGLVIDPKSLDRGGEKA